jgi:hypothetical protein
MLGFGYLHLQVKILSNFFGCQQNGINLLILSMYDNSFNATRFLTKELLSLRNSILIDFVSRFQFIYELELLT